MRLNILFTCAGRRNYLINYFKEALDGEGLVLAADKSVSAPALVDADLGVKMESVDDPSYIPELKSMIEDHKIAAVISLNDFELPILAAHKKELEALGTQVVVSSPEVIDITFDKWKTHQFLLENDLHSPKSYIGYDELKSAISSGEIDFPIVLKPRWGSASVGIFYAHSEKELDLAYQLQQEQLKNNSTNGVNFGEAIIFQERLEGIEYGIDVLNDFKGQYIASFAREKLSMRSGETDKAVSVISDELEMIGAKLGRTLEHIGNMDCDVFKCGNKYYVLELNPRFGGGYPFSHEAGVNTAAIYVTWLKGQKEIMDYVNYKDGVCFAKCDRMIKVKR